MKSAIVKPMPASSPAAEDGRPTDAVGQARDAHPHREPAERDDADGLPDHKPAATASATGSRSRRSANGTPAFASAKTGMMTNPTHGCSRLSRYSTGETISRVARWSVRT